MTMLSSTCTKHVGNILLVKRSELYNHCSLLNEHVHIVPVNYFICKVWRNKMLHKVNNLLIKNQDLPLCSITQACDFSGFFLISGFFANLPLPQNVLERREVATTRKERSSLYCVQTLQFLVCGGCGESVNPPKLNIQEVQGDPGPLPIFQDVLLVSNHSPDYIHYDTHKYLCLKDFGFALFSKLFHVFL